MYDKETFIDGLPEAMSRIATLLDLHHKMSETDSQLMTTDYSEWNFKVDRIMANFKKTLQRCQAISTDTKEVGVFAKSIDSLWLGKTLG